MSAMKTKISDSFEELIGNHYGSGNESERSNTAKMDALLANYYGKPKVRRKEISPAVTLSLHCDDGETLPQGAKQNYTEEYVVSQSVSDVPADEYIVEKGAMSGGNLADAAASAPGPRNAQAATQLDVLQPLRDAPAAEMKSGGSSQRETAQNYAPERRDRPQEQADEKPLFHKEVSEAKTTEDDFIADMQSILTGQKVFDPLSKKTVEKEQPGRGPSAPSGQNSPAPDNGQAIFDRIAQSMQYANAYDLGTVELENRFADFDKDQDKRQAAAKKKPELPAPVIAPTLSSGATVDSADFLRDLDMIHAQRATEGGAAQSPVTSVATAVETRQEYSRPFYDTGEHVLTGGDLYPDRLRVGRSPGVPFSYGQIIAMADLYDSAQQMMDTDAGELQRVKALIESSARYYTSSKSDKSADVSSDTWDTATNGRYMRLALDNFEHFSPNLTLLGKAGMSSAYQGRDHKTAWEKYHRLALEDAARMFVANPGVSVFPENALILNAFGDHFLTDAFAAGHSINKGEMLQLFSANFYNGDKLKPEGEAFFEKLAARAWHGKLQAEFSKLETTDAHLLVWHPSINSASRFADVLKGIAAAEPDQAKNIVVKALHDRLNRDGIDVFNNAGDGTWRLTGDGTLDKENIAIIRKAVQQSVDNVNEVAHGQRGRSAPDSATPVIDFAELAAKVWQHVPQWTEASRQKIQKLMREYTDPKSDTLIGDVAQLLNDKDQVDLLIKMILKRGDLRKA